MTTISSFESSKSLARSYAAFRPGQSGSITFRMSLLDNLNIDESNYTYIKPE